MSLPLLIILIPLIAGAVLWLPPFGGSGPKAAARSQGVASIASISTVCVAAVLFGRYNSSLGGVQELLNIPWIPSIGVRFAVGASGLAVLMVFLTSLVTCVALHWPRGQEILEVRGLLSGMLFTEAAVLGALLAQDLVLFYVFFELMLVPAYFLVGAFGGRRRISAATRFVTYTVAGSVVMLLALLIVGVGVLSDGNPDFLLSNVARVTESLPLQAQVALCCAFLLAVAIKTPIVPFHGWLPSLYVEAPTPVVVLLAALVGKVGLFALLQIVFPLFPDGVEVLRPYLAWLGAVAVLGGALMAWIQEDLRRILAYSSLSHLGYCVLAAAAGTEVALAGCVVQMVSHGLIIAPLFLLTGLVTDGSGVTRLTAWEGLANRVPRYSTLFLIFVLGSVGLPMTSGFIGEFLCLTGSFGKFPAATLVAALGVVFGAVYMFRLASHLLFGRLHGPRDDFAMRDLSGFELAAASGFVVLVLVIGIFPSLITEKVQIVPARIAAVTTSAGVH